MLSGLRRNLRSALTVFDIHRDAAASLWLSKKFVPLPAYRQAGRVNGPGRRNINLPAKRQVPQLRIAATLASTL